MMKDKCYPIRPNSKLNMDKPKHNKGSLEYPAQKSLNLKIALILRLIFLRYVGDMIFPLQMVVNNHF